MQVKTAKFIISCSSVKQYLDYVSSVSSPEICVVGRSNVGKSSFINAFTGNGKLARTSSTPGRTRLINLFDVNSSLFTLVDLPGYGFAKASKAEKESWDSLIGGYFENSPLLKHVIVLVDLRIPPTSLDKQMLAYLYHYALPFTVVATKADKLSRAQADRARQTVASELGIGKANVIVFSSVTKQGLDDVNALIGRVIEQE